MNAASEQRLGLYAWGGPGTVDMLKTKYRGWGTDIDEQSFLQMYEPAYLDKAKQLGVTDMWVTYSWGFSEERELSHRKYLLQRLKYFRQRGIRTHAYVQGPNVVTEDFGEQDIFCRDAHGKLLPYSTGRSMICVNNPQAHHLLLSRVSAAANEHVDGVFMDNIVFGSPPSAAYSDFLPFFGCRCSWCRMAFLETFGYQMPSGEVRDPRVMADCIALRCRATEALIASCSAICRKANKQFGVNLYDTVWHTPELYFGYSLEQLAPHLSYFLFENHALGENGAINNVHLRTVVSTTTKPVFIVSYRHGIGCDAQWSQHDVDAIASEAHALHYNPCLKGSEYIDGRTWHALRIDRLHPAKISAWRLPEPSIRVRRLPRSTAFSRIRSRIVSEIQMRCGRWFFEARLPKWINRRALLLRVCRTPRAFTASALTRSA